MLKIQKTVKNPIEKLLKIQQKTVKNPIENC